MGLPEILQSRPHWLIRWGTVILIGLLLVTAGSVWIVPYPLYRHVHITISPADQPIGEDSFIIAMELDHKDAALLRTGEFLTLNPEPTGIQMGKRWEIRIDSIQPLVDNPAHLTRISATLMTYDSLLHHTGDRRGSGGSMEARITLRNKKLIDRIL